VAQGRRRYLGQPLLVSQGGGDYPPEEDRTHWRVSIKERAADQAPIAAQYEE
jgi:hypothetical protein